MDATYNHLVTRVLGKWTEVQARGQQRLLIAIAGPPGSGKTTIAQEVVLRISSIKDGHPSILAVPADGFHYSQATLRTMPNSVEAFQRRGAPWTFDAAAIVALVRELKECAGRQDVKAPTFDHAVKDPVAGGLTISADTAVVIIEGNYLLSDETPWDEISELVDDRWLVNVDAKLARDRVAKRHVHAGIEPDMASAVRRAEGNDMVNGEYVRTHSHGRYDVLIDSVEESG